MSPELEKVGCYPQEKIRDKRIILLFFKDFFFTSFKQFASFQNEFQFRAFKLEKTGKPFLKVSLKALYEDK